MPSIQKISPFLWFDQQAEEAARFYTGIFPASRIVHVSRYPGAGEEEHGGRTGRVMTVEFELCGQPFTALNGGPDYPFTQAISFTIHCETQAEVDRYWTALTGDGGTEVACGWLRDKYGLSWQVTPTMLMEAVGGSDTARAGRAMAAMMKMKKIEIEAIRQACADET